MTFSDHIVGWREMGGRAFIDASDLLAALDREIVMSNQQLQGAVGEDNRARIAGMIVATERWRDIIQTGRTDLLRKAGMV